MQIPTVNKLHNVCYGKILLPVLAKANKTKIMECLDYLNKSQWWGTQTLKNLQQEKLRKIIKVAYHNVPFYHEQFKKRGLTDKDIQSVNDLSKLPVVDKTMVRNNWDHFINQNLKLNSGINSYTSGSTGMPMRFLLSRDQESWRWASRYRMWQWAGYQIGQPYANISVRPRNKWTKKFQDKVTRCTYLSLQNPNPGEFYKFLKLISDKNITFLVGYAHAVYLLAQFAEQEKINDIHLEGIVTHGESLFPYYRKCIEKQFQCKVTDLYGAGGEGFHVAAQCEQFGGYHINMENLIVEAVENGNGVSEIVVTGLDNTLMPLIRFNTKDIGRLSLKTCECGRGLALLDRIEGRICDLIVTPSGLHHSAHFFCVNFGDKKGIDNFQVVQKNIDRLTIKYVPNSNFRTTEIDDLFKIIAEATHHELSIDFQRVNEIPVSSSGKRRWVISDIWDSQASKKIES